MAGLKRVKILLVASAVSLVALLILFLSMPTKPTAQKEGRIQPPTSATEESASSLHITVSQCSAGDSLSYSLRIDGLGPREVEQLVAKRTEAGDSPTVTFVVADSVPLERIASMIEVAKRNGSKVVLHVP